MAPREVFTLATPAHQDGESSRHHFPAPLQDTQTLFASSSQVLSSSQLYTPHLSGSRLLNTSEVHKEVPQSLPKFDAHTPDGNSTMQSVPPYSPPTSETMQQNQYNPKFDAHVAPSAPVYGGSSQQPQPHSQPQSLPLPPAQTTQPRPSPGMDIRNMKGIPRDRNGEREWSHGCSECFDDCGTCILGCCCPCTVYSQVQTRLNHLETRGVPHPTGGDSWTSDCLFHGCLTTFCGLGWVLQIGQRTAVRSRYRIAGGGCGDCMMAYCCSPCELTQASRELDLEERALFGAAPMQQQMQQPPAQSNLPNPYPEKR